MNRSRRYKYKSSPSDEICGGAQQTYSQIDPHDLRRRGKVTPNDAASDQVTVTNESWTFKLGKSRQNTTFQKIQENRSPANLRYQVAWQCAQNDKKASGPCVFVRAFSQPLMKALPRTKPVEVTNKPAGSFRLESVGHDHSRNVDHSVHEWTGPC